MGKISLRACIVLTATLSPLPVSAQSIPAEVEEARRCTLRALTAKVRTRESIEVAVHSAIQRCRNAFASIQGGYEREMRGKYKDHATAVATDFAEFARRDIRNDARRFLHRERAKLPYGWNAPMGREEAAASAKCAGLMRWMAGIGNDPKVGSVYRDAHALLLGLARAQFSRRGTKPDGARQLEALASAEVTELQAGLERRSGAVERQAFIKAQLPLVRACSLRIPKPLGPAPILEEPLEEGPVKDWIPK